MDILRQHEVFEIEVLEKMNSMAMDKETFAKETNLETDSATEYLRRLTSERLLNRDGAK